MCVCYVYVWSHISGSCVTQSMRWTDSQTNSHEVFSLTSGNASSWLIRQTCQSTSHRLHFTNFNPSSSHCFSSVSVSFLVFPSIPLPRGPSHSPSPSIPCGLNFPLGIKDKEELFSERRTCWNKTVYGLLFVCVRESLCVFNRTEMGQLEAVDLVGKEYGTEWQESTKRNMNWYTDSPKPIILSSREVYRDSSHQFKKEIMTRSLK